MIPTVLLLTSLVTAPAIDLHSSTTLLLHNNRADLHRFLGLDRPTSHGYIEVIEPGGFGYYPPAAPTPEPSTLILLGSGLLAPVLYRRILNHRKG